MDATLQGIFRDRIETYKRRHKMSIDQHRAAQAIMTCRSDAMGYDEWVCPNGDHLERIPHSCRHRSCPICHGRQSHTWLENAQRRLLPIDHYHVIFTMPHELNALWAHNRQWCSDRLFKAASETLSQLLADARYLGAEVGMLCALHTWGRTLSFHPHLHVLVSGGGLAGETFRSIDNGFLLPVGVIKAKFRGKWLAWLNRAFALGEIDLPTGWTLENWKRVLRRVARKGWNIRIEGPYRHGDGVAVYLSRYVNGGPIKNQRILKANADKTHIAYRDYRDGKTKILSLTTDHFMERVLWHVPVKGQHQTRYYGLYVSGAKCKRNRIRDLVGEPAEAHATAVEDRPARCPRCAADLIRRCSTRRGISSIRKADVQQEVQVDRARPVPRVGSRVNDPPTIFFCRGAST